MSSNRTLALGLLGVLLLGSGPALGAATITIVNGDPAGVGFNDATAVAPVGGNTGTTLGAQRLIAFQAAANKWGATLTSAVPIRVYATWEALTCTATSAVLGSAGALYIYVDTPGATPNRLYGKALAEKLAGAQVDPDSALTPPFIAEIRARFNVNLGQANCLTGSFFYLGLDAAAGTNVDLVTVLEHEFAHGLGFQTFTSGSTGAPYAGYFSVWDDFLFDTTTNKTWAAMTTNAERVTSALNSRKLVWTGPSAIAQVPNVLSQGTPILTVAAPASVAGNYSVGSASFGPPLSSPGVTGEFMQVVDTAGNLGLACTPLTALNAAAVAGKIALVDRGTCSFDVKTMNAQNAGALAVVIADNAAGSPPAGMSSSGVTGITIPAVRITQADGVALKAAITRRSRLHSGLTGTLGLNLAIRSGADAAGRPLLFTPNPFQSGSSVSHWDTIASPNQLMEPSINTDLTHEVTPPNDLTFPLLQDIGW